MVRLLIQGRALALLFEKRLNLGSLVVGAAVDHVVADQFLLAVTGYRPFGNSEQLAHVLVVEQCVAVERVDALLLDDDLAVDTVEPFNDRLEHLLYSEIIHYPSVFTLHDGFPVGLSAMTQAPGFRTVSDAKFRRQNTGINQLV